MRCLAWNKQLSCWCWQHFLFVWHLQNSQHYGFKIQCTLWAIYADLFWGSEIHISHLLCFPSVTYMLGSFIIYSFSFLFLPFCVSFLNFYFFIIFYLFLFLKLFSIVSSFWLNSSVCLSLFYHPAFFIYPFSFIYFSVLSILNFFILLGAYFSYRSFC